MKKLAAALMASLMLSSSMMSFSFAEERELNVNVNNYLVVFLDAKPYIDENQRTLVPISFIAKNIGAEVKWDAENSKVYIDDGVKKIVITIDSNKVLVNGEEKTIDTKAILKDGRTFVPLAFLTECLGGTVSWDDKTWTVNVVTKLPDRDDIKAADLKDYYKVEATSDDKPIISDEYKYIEIDHPVKFSYEIEGINITGKNLSVTMTEKSPVDLAVVDSEGRYYSLEKSGDKSYVSDHFASSEVKTVVMYDNNMKFCYIYNIKPDVKIGV